ncbi:hypothetical protein QBC47DRAFT_377161 [Echria macrotheca]|uniref:Uncharacterized protein n=1 Tax=Echria macrotheca TaxID=438768 RepID=A0AAJ0FE72_9PEZI|nr:hypothetical protein QBC47DRAFT_377161 [Echria macrotheca]
MAPWSQNRRTLQVGVKRGRCGRPLEELQHVDEVAVIKMTGVTCPWADGGVGTAHLCLLRLAHCSRPKARKKDAFVGSFTCCWRNRNSDPSAPRSSHCSTTGSNRQRLATTAFLSRCSRATPPKEFSQVPEILHKVDLGDASPRQSTWAATPLLIMPDWASWCRIARPWRFMLLPLCCPSTTKTPLMGIQVPRVDAMGVEMLFPSFWSA